MNAKWSSTKDNFDTTTGLIGVVLIALNLTCPQGISGWDANLDVDGFAIITRNQNETQPERDQGDITFNFKKPGYVD